MTINELQRQLIAEIEQLAKEVSLVDKAGKPATVSYTHLDVYKRQWHFRQKWQWKFPVKRM